MVEPEQTSLLHLPLDDLVTGFPHIPPECGTVLAQAIVVCLGQHEHGSGVALRVSGVFQGKAAVELPFCSCDD
jgi:hypothetical protein